MIVTVPGVVDTTHPDANDYTLTWLPSHKTLIQCIEAIDRTSPCSAVIILQDRGTEDNYKGCALLPSQSAGFGYSVCWSNYEITVDEHDQVRVIFQNALVGDIVEVHLHVRQP
jgi:hypothetical protein